MDGGTDGWMDGCREGWMDEWREGCVPLRPPGNMGGDGLPVPGDILPVTLCFTKTS
jgi:hypothetical protein